VDVAKEVGKLIAARLQTLGVEKVVLIEEDFSIMAASKPWRMQRGKKVLNFKLKRKTSNA